MTDFFHTSLIVLFRKINKVVFVVDVVDVAFAAATTAAAK